MSANAVQIVGESGRTRAEAALVTAFASDPVARWVFARPEDFLAKFPLVLKHMAGGAFSSNTAFGTADGRAAALWLPAGVEPDMEALGSAMEDIEAPEASAEFFEQMASHHPTAPHWYLPFIGVDPGAQGKGHGSALLAASLAAVDAAGMPAYLESSNLRNVSLYERFGFRVTAEIQVGDSPPMHPMWRRAGG